MKSKKRIRILNSAIVVPFCLIGFMLLAGCAYLSEYNKAQDYFNIAAEADNRQKFIPDDPGGSEELVSIGNIRANYTLAHKSISNVLDNNYRKLEGDGLLGSALTIKALCEWKLGRYDDALATSDQALRHLRSESGVPGRDLALMIAMPGLIKADQAYFYTMPLSKVEKSYDDIKQIIEGAIRDFDDAQKVVDEMHPVQPFLQMSRLAVYRTWEVAIQKKIAGESEKFEQEEIVVARIKQELKILEKLIGKDNEIYRYWENILGF